MENKKIITEELNRIKNLMGYDRSKTLNENINEGKYDTSDGKIARWLLPSGDIITGDKIKGMIPTGAEQLNAKNAIDAVSAVSTVSSLTGGGGATAAVTGAEVVGAGAVGAVGAEGAAAATFLGLGPVGWTILGVAGLAALGVWAYTKDDDMDMIKTLFGICESSKEKDKWKRYMSDEEVKKNSGILFHAMEGVGTDEAKIYDVFRLFKSPGDFCAVSKQYESSFNESLLDALDGDFDYGWEPIAASLVDMTKNYAQTESEEYCKNNVKECADKLKLYCEKNPKDDKCKDVVKDDVKDDDEEMTYKTCSGTYSVGCKDGEDDDIYALQVCLGITKNGKFDKNTEKVLKDKTGKTTITNREIWKLCDEYNRKK
jgi:hypothetical protein